MPRIDMSLKEKLVSSHILFQEKYPSIDYLEDIRFNAVEKFEKLGFPNKRDEEWKYTNLNPILKREYKLNFTEEKTLDYKEVKKYFIDDIDSYKIVFINGIYSSWLSEATHDECDVCIISSALTQEKHVGVIKEYFGKIAHQDHNMTLLNTAFCKEGAYIKVPNGTVVSKPIQIVYFTTTSQNTFNQHRNLVVVGDNAQVQIIERHQNIASTDVLTNSVTEISVGKNAHLDYHKIQDDQYNADLIDSTYVRQADDSTATVHTFSFGGRLTRNNLSFEQKGRNINSILKAITVINKKQHVDHHTLVDHQTPNCESHELYKGIFDDSANGVFNGKIMVHQEAQKTNAFQQNNNVLLSNSASVDTKPQLEIFADDVKCSHGCTIGKLDEEALFYLQSRGIPKKEAKALLLYAFASDVLDSVSIPQLKKRILKQLSDKLGTNFELSL